MTEEQVRKIVREELQQAASESECPPGKPMSIEDQWREVARRLLSIDRVDDDGDIWIGEDESALDGLCDRADSPIM